MFGRCLLRDRRDDAGGWRLDGFLARVSFAPRPPVLHGANRSRSPSPAGELQIVSLFSKAIRAHAVDHTPLLWSRYGVALAAFSSPHRTLKVAASNCPILVVRRSCSAAGVGAHSVT